MLPDGRLLLLGGQPKTGISAAAAIEDPVSGTISPLEASGVKPRAWHTATLLADGRILVFGGIGSTGRVERSTQVLEIRDTRVTVRSAAIGPAARARHTATVITDGRVLFAGGTDATGLLAHGEVWDPDTGALTTRPMAGGGRAGHIATLQPDGSVLIAGGTSGSGAALPDELFSPELGEFVQSPAGPAPITPSAYLASSLPDHGEVEVDPRVRVSIRFSAELDVRSITFSSVRLEGVTGPIDARVLPTEDGRLVFLTPARPLDEGAAYSVVIDGVRAKDGHAVPFTSITFTTRDQANAGASDGEGEEWRPTAEHVRGNWRTGRPNSPWRQLPALKAAPGVTALAGQVLALNGRPLADIQIGLGPATTVTDRTGRFLLQGIAHGKGVLTIDGTLGGRSRDFGLYHARVYVKPGQTNVLEYASWLPRIDHAHAVRIPSPTTSEVLVTTPLIPGLELRVPKGAVIRDAAGKPVPEITITPVPVDRPPFPLPTGVQVPVYFTIQPGGAFIEMPNAAWPAGARVVYPNYTFERPGTRMNFWNYDPEERGWHVYGEGAVEPRGQQVVPDAGVQIYRFTGTMINWGPTPPGTGPSPGWWPFGDPVDPATGLFVLEKTDLYLPDVLPLALTRTYRQNDTASRPFGIGATHPYAMFLWSAQQYQEVDLVLPDGGRVHYVRTSPGTGFWDAEFEHASTPTKFYRSRIVHNHLRGGWDLTLKDGTVYYFGDSAPLQEIRDRHGNKIRFTYASSNGLNGTGNLLKVTSPNGRWIEFAYDAANRITGATDNIGRTVVYEYDGSGRLWKVTDPAGGITEYTYDSSHRMLTLKDARGIVYLTNEYDPTGRVMRQTQADATTYQFAYTLDGGGRVVQTDVTSPSGSVDRLTFNTSGYPTSHVEALGTAQARTTTFTRRSDNLLESATDPLNRRTDYSYDANGNLTTVTRLAGTADAVTTSFTYEPAFHQVASVTDPLNHTTTFGYDSQGRLTSVTDPLNQQTTLAYNAAGQPTAATDPLNQMTQLGYEFGDLVSVTDPPGPRDQPVCGCSGPGHRGDRSVGPAHAVRV